MHPRGIEIVKAPTPHHIHRPEKKAEHAASSGIKTEQRNKILEGKRKRR
jgi:hypothetical protein